MIGTASIVRMAIPKEILENLEIDNTLTHIFLVLTCAHNVVYQESIIKSQFSKANEIFILIGKQ